MAMGISDADQELPIAVHRLHKLDVQIEQYGVGGIAHGKRQRVLYLRTELEGLLIRPPSAA